LVRVNAIGARLVSDAPARRFRKRAGAEHNAQSGPPPKRASYPVTICHQTYVSLTDAFFKQTSLSIFKQCCEKETPPPQLLAFTAR